MKRINSAHPGPRATGFAILFSLLYVGSFLASVWHDPLLRAPQLDAAEMVHTAKAIDASELPPEPFYRSMGFPWLLAKIGGAASSETYGLRGAAWGVLGHLLNALLVGIIATLAWKHSGSGLLAGTLYAIYPVSLFFAVQLLDITWGITCFLAAVGLILKQFRDERVSPWLIVSGLFLGCAIVTRPHFLFCVPVFVLLLFLVNRRYWGGRGWIRMSAVAACMLPLLIQSYAGWSLSGEWRWMPWQGAYNLFAANEASANGKYFVQSTVVTDRPESVNPARAESIARYAQETASTPPYSIEAMSRHWRARFLEEVQSNPMDWAKLLFRKTYYIFNNFEQYNNLTYAFHKARWPFLRWNPLGWGVLLLGGLAAMGLVRVSPKVLSSGLLLAGAYGASLVLFYASARFRLPLVPFLAVAAGGLALLPIQSSLPSSRLRQVGTGAILLLGAIVTFSGWDNADDRSTYVQDSMLVGNAATATGDDALAMSMAMRAMEMDSSREDARRLALVSYWNRRLTSPPGAVPPFDWNFVFENWVRGRTFEHPDAPLAVTLATVLWHQGRRSEATAIWRDVQAANPNDAAKALLSIAGGDVATLSPAERDAYARLLGLKDAPHSAAAARVVP